ncbi:S-adenosyl-L-methionine-dependent methyltransferase [Fomitiporia mediterranea MF3/22]|uniref:S-adenosyl-L-methionine-dependent methyltransferase n=1 Tax=Fomitiporia mediterranea (strain MF3/22) TaxID=694068 RepID=UPI0004409547|nr:S-adenosyl-L-methionine-dependent methyltransferase [Fomitiporia mediterranea MF3/22]EJD00021.1 S-adenosyl-L-methionine-dependent methyltransferase [Fomitiporia mediterranea MF3/22]
MSNSPVSGKHVDEADRYALPRNEVERARLDSQHARLTEILGGRLILDDSVQLKPGDRVLDSGTGAASWIIDLSNHIPKTVGLIGIDISTAMFPKDLPSNVNLMEMSSTSLPAEWSNSFTLVSQRLLMSAFTASLWRTALAELIRVLKPGGTIQLMESGKYDSLHISPKNLTALKKATDIALAISNLRGVLSIACVEELPTMLSEVGFSEVQIQNFRSPLGEQWGDLGAMNSRNFEVLLRGFGAMLMAEGGLGVCQSQAEVDETIELAKKEWDGTPGVFIHFAVFTARKPL